MKRAIAAGAIAAAILAPAGSTDTGEPAGVSFPSCVVRVWEDGSSAFRDAEDVRADPVCFDAVSDYVEARTK